MEPRALIIVYSYHQKNTETIARQIAKILDADIKTPQEVDENELQKYALLGFGSGIYHAKHHQFLLELADRLPKTSNRKVFLFSTDGAPRAVAKNGIIPKEKNHWALREKLQAKGYTTIGEFNCGGYNTNSFLKYFGGLNKGRPNAEDFRHAEEFARSLQVHLEM